MSLPYYYHSSQHAPSLQHPTPMRRLVLIDTASRLATRILDRQREATICVTPATGPDEIEAFRLGCAVPVFASIADQLSKHDKQQTICCDTNI